MRTMEILSSIAVATDKVINLSEVLLNGMVVLYYHGRYGSLMTNSTSGSSSLGLSSYQGNCVVFFAQTLYSHSASLSVNADCCLLHPPSSCISFYPIILTHQVTFFSRGAVREVLY